MTRSIAQLVLFPAWLAGFTVPCCPQTTPQLQEYFREDIKLSQKQISAIRNGQPVAKDLPVRSPSEVWVFGAVYIHAAAERYVTYARDFSRLRKNSEFPGIGTFSAPPQLSDLDGFTLDSNDVKALKGCKPGDCGVQLSADWIAKLQRGINWNAPDAEAQANRLFQNLALQLLLGYQRAGNPALGVYYDKKEPVDVAQQFRTLLTYASGMQKRVPECYNYLLNYPDSKPANARNTFYWTKVQFGLKPTLRIVHSVTMQGNTPQEPAYTIAEKQLYSSHYFRTALDVALCIPGTGAQGRPGFYLVLAAGSEQDGLTGPKGAVVRRAAVKRAVSSLEKLLVAAKRDLEQSR